MKSSFLQSSNSGSAYILLLDYREILQAGSKK
jgi:hypothetical protein